MVPPKATGYLGSRLHPVTMLVSEDCDPTGVMVLSGPGLLPEPVWVHGSMQLRSVLMTMDPDTIKGNADARDLGCHCGHVGVQGPFCHGGHASLRDLHSYRGLGPGLLPGARSESMSQHQLGLGSYPWLVLS